MRIASLMQEHHSGHAHTTMVVMHTPLWSKLKTNIVKGIQNITIFSYENYKYNSLEHSYKTEKGKCLWWELNPMPLICQMSALDC